MRSAFELDFKEIRLPPEKEEEESRYVCPWKPVMWKGQVRYVHEECIICMQHCRKILLDDEYLWESITPETAGRTIDCVRCPSPLRLMTGYPEPHNPWEVIF